ncbi:hypothetical protein RO3G_13982 [Rhizopus delemar RA 99-880]|uniref:Uncharacterized protein n=1 Tax=Rhizopus delemar (strain RA 99-880 / ATCC MYA-4621 / FGSC 9543 / NRRL 43880) TaxID=246409 RepID=I1CLE1_RHIO9|nr:hypothetical protein RO3G_13982 [Rhizopus delemar RA 99-880]|eukprot:EIE89271.1 hypothetical protein RO3G_13982 [Rhizopus delemar RA 99-880]
MTRSIIQATQSGSRVLLKTDLSYKEVVNRLTLSLPLSKATAIDIRRNGYSKDPIFISRPFIPKLDLQDSTGHLEKV